jgi:hypothetical protein
MSETDLSNQRIKSKFDLDVGQMLKTAWDLIKHNWLAFVTVILIITALPVGFMAMNSDYFSKVFTFISKNTEKDEFTGELTFDEEAIEDNNEEVDILIEEGEPLIFPGLIMILATVTLSMVLYAGMIDGVLNWLVDKESIDIITMFKSGLRSFLPIIFSSFIAGLIILLGLIAFFIPGVILAYRFILIPVVVVKERLGAIKALKRSYNIVKGNSWTVFFYMFGASVATGVANEAVVGTFGIYGLPLTMFATVFQVIVAVYLYLSLTSKEVKEDSPWINEKA